MALFDVVNLGKRTVPIVDGGRIWSMDYDDSISRYRAIQYSDDYGDSWVDWYVFQGADPIAALWSLHRDMQGNFYYNSASSSALAAYGYASERFCRVDGVTKAITTVIEFVFATTRDVGSIVNVATQDYISNIVYAGCVNWGFTQGPDGTIYVAQYGGNGTKYVPFVWVSPVGGQAFTRKDWFFLGAENQGSPGTWHVHGIRAISNGDVYIANGDIPRNVFRSADKLETQPTRLTLDGSYSWSFTDSIETAEAFYVSTDEPNMQNSVVKVVGNNTTRVWTAPGLQEKIPLYYIQAIGNDELWISGFEEVFQGDYTYQYIGRLTKSGVGGNWTLTEVWEESPTNNSSGTGLNPWQIAKAPGQSWQENSAYPYMFITMVSPYGSVSEYAIPGAVWKIARTASPGPTTTTTPGPTTTTTTPAPGLHPVRFHTQAGAQQFDTSPNGALRVVTSAGVIGMELGDTGAVRVETSLGVKAIQ